jgi:hypothetical protein
MRKLTPELLDLLPHDDPGAIRSRGDLRRINRFMGNDSWIIRTVGRSPAHITEIGAGDGLLLSKLSKIHSNAKMDAYDLAPRPAYLPEKANWHRGDILAQTSPSHGGVLIANLFLHHFTDDQLRSFAPWLHGFDTVVINEPLRARLPLLLGKAAYPFIHPITRHDMRVSTEAGFVPGELPGLLGFDAHGFGFHEVATWRGAIRITARKQ